MKKAWVFMILIMLLSLSSSELALGSRYDCKKYFTHVKTITIKIYFVRWGSTTQGLIAVESVVPYTKSVGQIAILKLLEGPTEEERKRLSLDTAIPRGTRLDSIWIEEGVIYVDFSKELQNYGGGSAMCLAIRAQIERTIIESSKELHKIDKEFQTVKEVIITVEGKGEREGILQP